LRNTIRSRSPSAVIGPRRKEHAGRDLDLLVERIDDEAALHPAVGQRLDGARLPFGDHRRRIETVARMIDDTDSHHVAMRAVRPVRVRHRRLGRHCVPGMVLRQRR
jgi:hypothetical protein